MRCVRSFVALAVLISTLYTIGRGGGEEAEGEGFEDHRERWRGKLFQII